MVFRTIIPSFFTSSGPDAALRQQAAEFGRSLMPQSVLPSMTGIYENAVPAIQPALNPEIIREIVRPAVQPVVTQVIQQIAQPLIAPEVTPPVTAPIDANAGGIYQSLENGWKVVQPYITAAITEVKNNPKLEIAFHIFAFLGIVYVCKKTKLQNHHFTVEGDADRTRHYKIQYEDKGKTTTLVIEVPPDQNARVINEEEV